jgi:hypothetical protein
VISYIGIDPGMTGAVAIVDTHFIVIDCPVFEKMKSNERTSYDLLGMSGLLEQYQKNTFAVLEELHPQSKPIGAVANFHMGRGFGLWEMALVANGIPYIKVLPNKWKKAMGLNTNKDFSRQKAIELFPLAHERLKRKKDHGRAEALLLAEYGRMFHPK